MSQLKENDYKKAECCANCIHSLPSGERSENFDDIWCTKHHKEVKGRMICNKYK